MRDMEDFDHLGPGVDFADQDFLNDKDSSSTKKYLKRVKDFGKRNWRRILTPFLAAGIVAGGYSAYKNIDKSAISSELFGSNPAKVWDLEDAKVKSEDNININKALEGNQKKNIPDQSSDDKFNIGDSVINALKENSYLSEEKIYGEGYPLKENDEADSKGNLKEAIKGLEKWPEKLGISEKLVAAQMLHEAGWADINFEEPYKGFMEFQSSDGLPMAKEIYDKRAEWYLNNEELEDYRKVCGENGKFSREKLNRNQTCNIATASLHLKDLKENFEGWTGIGEEWGIDYDDIWEEPLVYDFTEDGKILYRINRSGLSSQEEKILDNKLEMYEEVFEDPRTREFTQEEIENYKRENKDGDGNSKIPVSELPKMYFLGNGRYTERIGKIGTKERGPNNEIREEYPFEVMENFLDLTSEYKRN